MNRDVIQRVGELHPPAVEYDLNFSSSIALNMFDGESGSIYILCEDGHIRHTNMSCGASQDGPLGEQGGSTMNVLELEGVESLVDMNFSGIEFNFSGSILLVSGQSSLGVVFLPKPSTATDLAPAPKSELMMLYRANFSKDEIAKVMWHPLSDKHVVVLLKTNKMMMFDVVEGTESEYLLDASKRYTSFCFGPSLDWLTLSVFLLDSHADVTCMCPLLPTGSVVPTNTIIQLNDWLSDSFVERMSPPYLERVDAYLRAAFGTREGGRVEEEGELRRAGVSRGAPLQPDHPLHDVFYGQPQLQGPLVVEGRMKTKMLKLGKGKSSGGEAEPCDVCMPAASLEGEGAVLLVTWSDGVVEQLLLGEVVGPSWEEGQGKLCCAPPSLVHMETLSLCSGDGEEEEGADCYILQCDPLNSTALHVTARRRGRCFLLQLDWLCSTFSSGSDSHPDSPPLSESSAHVLFQHPLGQGISGQVLASDPVLGRVAIFRGQDGYASAVNLSVEEHLMRLDSSVRLKDQALAPLEDSSGGSTVSSISRSTDAVLSGVIAALKTVPAASYSDQEASASKYGEALKKIVVHLGKEAVDPLEEFEFGMKFATESLRETYNRQRAALFGVPPADVSLSSSSVSLAAGGENEEGTGAGLLAKYEAAMKRHTLLKKQLDAAGARLLQQKQVAASSLHLSKQRGSSLTRAEELYALQVKRWATVYQRLEVSLERVREQAEAISGSSLGQVPAGRARPDHISSSGGTPSRPKKKAFMTPTKPRSTPSRSSLLSGHVSSPHRLSYRHSPATHCSPASSNTPRRPQSQIQLFEDERNSCDQLQHETGKLQEALRLKISNVEARLTKLSSAV